MLKHNIVDKRPWGGFERFTLNEKSTVKLIVVKPDEQLSYQFHKKRSEFWHFTKGNGRVMIDDIEFPIEAGKEFFIEKGRKHRVSAGNAGCEFLEIAFGTFDENDIIRLDDKYGRDKRKNGQPKYHKD